MIKIEWLHTMWVRANDEINAVINQPAGEFTLFVSDCFCCFQFPSERGRRLRSALRPRFR